MMPTIIAGCSMPIVLEKKRVPTQLEKKKKRGERQAGCAVGDSSQTVARQVLAGHV
jgi:hypothetical protein